MSSSPAVLVPGRLAVLSAKAPGPADTAGAGLLEALSQVPDPRDRRGVRYGLVAVLAAAVCATLAGARSYSAIAEWVHDAAPQQRAALGLHGQVPDLVTIWRVLTAVDPAALVLHDGERGPVLPGGGGRGPLHRVRRRQPLLLRPCGRLLVRLTRRACTGVQTAGRDSSATGRDARSAHRADSAKTARQVDARWPGEPSWV
jgi:hypothetical protein